MTKKTKYIIAVIVGIVVIGGGALAYSNSQEETIPVASSSNEEAISETPAMTNTESQPSAPQPTAGSYVTLSEYSSDPTKYASSNKVYFFHASWCPICVSIDKDFKDGSAKIPANTVMIKTDFDSQTELRKKYGVTTQYTFVQVDSNGNETAQWTASTSSKAVAGIKT